MASAALANKQTAPLVHDLIVGQSPAILDLKTMIDRVSRSNVSVMITGPSGSGKEMVARAIHAASGRSNKAFVPLNCGAIPVDLIESELFGHERGSFTGASSRRTGRFEEANGGTIFLDEIGDMRFDMQVKLLRVLEDGEISRVGGNGSMPVDVRVISATHQNLGAAIEESRFREDLYFRLGVVLIHVPDLASRAEDIPLLIAHFQKKAGARGTARFNSAAIDRLMAHQWPGNVRELRNVLERANVLHPGELIGAREVEQLIGVAARTPRTVVELRPEPVAEIQPESAPASVVFRLPVTSRAPASAPIPINLKELLETMELERIQMALDMADGVISEAARMLTLKRTTLIEKMRKYGVDRQC